MRLAVATLGCLYLCSALAQVPSRKSGLWAESETSSFFPGQVTKAVHCIDSITDRLDLEMRDGSDPGSCGQATATRKGEELKIEKRCKRQDSVTEVVAIIRGDLNSKYEAQFVTRYVPPYEGRSELRGTLNARWTGPCPPGQRPGDVILENGTKMNLIDIRNAPVYRSPPVPQNPNVPAPAPVPR